MSRPCAGCGRANAKAFACAVCRQEFCRACCKRYLSLEAAPTEQVRACNACFLRNVNWDSSRTIDTFGPAGGRPVLLVHGALIGRQCLVLEARALAAAGFRVIVPDLSAHGARFAEAPLTLDNAVETLRDAAAKEAPGQKVVVMGFSMGGYVAAAFAARHPELVAGAALAACAHDTHNATWAAVGRLGELAYSLCSYRTKCGFIYNNCPEVMCRDRPEIQEAFLRAGAEFDAWRYTWRVMYDADMKALLPRVTCPTLVVVGERDFRSHERAWLSLLRDGRLLVLPGGLHQFMVQPGVVDEWRAEAAAFASAAFAAADGRGAAGAGGVQPETAAPKQAPPPPRTHSRVGVGTVFANLWAQRRGGGGGGGGGTKASGKVGGS